MKLSEINDAIEKAFEDMCAKKEAYRQSIKDYYELRMRRHVGVVKHALENNRNVEVEFRRKVYTVTKVEMPEIMTMIDMFTPDDRIQVSYINSKGKEVTSPIDYRKVSVVED